VVLPLLNLPGKGEPAAEFIYAGLFCTGTGSAGWGIQRLSERGSSEGRNYREQMEEKAREGGKVEGQFLRTCQGCRGRS